MPFGFIPNGTTRNKKYVILDEDMTNFLSETDTRHPIQLSKKLKILLEMAKISQISLRIDRQT